MKLLYIKYLYILVFASLISTIGILSVLNIKKNASEKFINIENRLPAKMPDLKLDVNSIKNYFPALESCINDKFSLRTNLIETNSWLHFMLGVSSKPNKVLIGKNNFLFLGNKFNSIIDQLTGKSIFSNKELEDWKISFAKKNRYIEKMGAKMYILIAPNKHSIYPEYLPKHVVRSKLNRLSQVQNSDLDFNIICAKDTLLKAKTEWDTWLYGKTDSHWTIIGAYIAYLELINNISADFDKLKPIVLNNSSFNCIKTNSICDLEKQLYLKSNNSTKVNLTKNKDWNDNLIKTNYNGDTLAFNSMSAISNNDNVVIINKQKPYKILILRDSFTGAMSLFLNQTFGKLIYCHYAHDEGKELTQLIEKYKPDIVLYEFVERMLVQKQKVHPNILYKLSDYKFRTLKKMNGDYLFKNIIPLNQITDIKFQNNAVNFLSTGIDPYLLLPKLELSHNKHVAIEIDFTVPKNTTAQLFYCTNNDKKFSKEKRINFKAIKGRNNLKFVLPEKEINGKRIRFDPGNKSGKYIIHSVEILEEE